jgi:hypothetical protein
MGYSALAAVLVAGGQCTMRHVSVRPRTSELSGVVESGQPRAREGCFRPERHLFEVCGSPVTGGQVRGTGVNSVEFSQRR